MVDRDAIPHVERRTFLRYSLMGSVAAGLGGFGLAAFGFAWPRPGDGLHGEIDVGDADELVSQIRTARAPLRIPGGGVSVVVWDPSHPGADLAYGAQHAITDGGSGLMALNTAACPHLGCSVPWCQSSQWFECPCHGSRYNRWGEWTKAPAPRGLDRYASRIVDGRLVIDLGDPLTGTARTAGVLEQPPEGPSCV